MTFIERCSGFDYGIDSYYLSIYTLGFLGHPQGYVLGVGVMIVMFNTLFCSFHTLSCKPLRFYKLNRNKININYLLPFVSF